MAVMLVLFGINVMAYFAMAWDKRLAETGARSRIPERTLLLLALFGGALGALIGQQLFRHKTQKQPFRTLLWLAAVVNILIAVVVIRLNWLAI